jgi:deoxycytidylate deaminase
MYLDVIGNGVMPCPSCRRVILNAGIREVHFRRRDGTVEVRNNAFFTSTEDQWIERTLKSHSSLEQ